MLRRRASLPLFALVFGTYAYFYQAGGWNQNSRFDLTRAIVEQHTLSIDAFQENTGDKAQRDGHWFTDKAPGLSVLAVPAYAVVHARAAGGGGRGLVPGHGVRGRAAVGAGRVAALRDRARPRAVRGLVGGADPRLRAGDARPALLHDLLRPPALGGARPLRLRAGLAPARTRPVRTAPGPRRRRRLHVRHPGDRGPGLRGREARRPRHPVADRGRRAHRPRPGRVPRGGVRTSPGPALRVRAAGAPPHGLVHGHRGSGSARDGRTARRPLPRPLLRIAVADRGPARPGRAGPARVPGGSARVWRDRACLSAPQRRPRGLARRLGHGPALPDSRHPVPRHRRDGTACAPGPRALARAARSPGWEARRWPCLSH